MWTGSTRSFDEAAAGVLPPSEHESARSFAFERDRQRHLSTRLMVRRVLSRYADVDPRRWSFRENEWGRPEIAGPALAQPLYFNLSHAREHIVCAVARFADLGIDVEGRYPEDSEDLAARFFAQEEYRWFARAADASERRHRFLTIWTLKEAYIKALGMGLSKPLDSFHVLPRGAHEASVVDRDDLPGSPGWWFWRTYVGDSALALAARSGLGEAPALELLTYA